MEGAGQLNIGDLFGSIGWLVDRTVECDNILGTVWVAEKWSVITCGHLLAAFYDSLEALEVQLPATGQTFGIAQAGFHPDFDQYSSRRKLTESNYFFPPPELNLQEQNMVVLRLTNQLRPVQPETLSKVDHFWAVNVQGDPGFSGRLTNLELASVVQTLVNARKRGTIVILDLHRRPVARLFCEQGRLSHIRYRDLVNEAAMYKLMCGDFEGYFFFQEEEQVPPWCNFAPMTKQTPALLMEAFRRLEEKGSMLATLGGIGAVTLFRGQGLSMMHLPPEYHADARVVCPNMQDGMPISCLIEMCELDAASVVRIVYALTQAGQIETTKVPPLTADNLPFFPLEGGHFPSAMDQIYAMSIDPKSRLPIIQEGQVVAARRANDDLHFYHTMNLPSFAIGAPILRGDVVIGLNCGPVPPDNKYLQQWPHIQQFVAVNGILACLGRSTAAPAAPVTPPEAVDPIMQALKNASALRAGDPASPPRQQSGGPLSSGTGTSALRGGSPPINRAGQREAQSVTGSQRDTGKGFLGVFRKGPQGPQDPWLDVDIQRCPFGSDRWLRAGPDDFHTGDMMRVSIRLNQDGYVYVMFQSSSAPGVHLIYPESTYKPPIITKGMTVNAPDKPIPASGPGSTPQRGTAKAGIPIIGTRGKDSILFVMSKNPLKFLKRPEQVRLIYPTGMDLLEACPDLQSHDIQESEFHDAFQMGQIAPERGSMVSIAKLEITHEN